RLSNPVTFFKVLSTNDLRPGLRINLSGWRSDCSSSSHTKTTRGGGEEAGKSPIKSPRSPSSLRCCPAPPLVAHPAQCPKRLAAILWSPARGSRRIVFVDLVCTWRGTQVVTLLSPTASATRTLLRRGPWPLRSFGGHERQTGVASELAKRVRSG